MAKKVIASTDKVNADGENIEKKPVKKNRGVCCTCCLIVLVFLIVVLAASFGVGWYIGDKMTKQYLDMSLADTFDVMNELYWTKDKHVVTNPYSDEDLNGFYNQIKTNMLLKEGADIDFDAAIEAALRQMNGNDGQDKDGAEAAPKTSADGGTDGGEGNADSGEESGTASVMDLFVNMVVDVFTRDNIDVERLKNYAENNDEYIFVLRDKQLAAFADKLIKALLGSGADVAGLKDVVKNVSLDKAISLKQIRFRAESELNEMGEDIITATVADITVWIGLQDAVGGELGYYLEEGGFGWASGLARWLGNVFLPKNLYITVSVPLNGESDMQVTLNDMNAAKRDRTYKLINGIMALSGGGDHTVQSMLAEAADKIAPYMESAAGIIDFSSSAQGAVKLDLIGTMAKMASDNLSEGEPITKPEFMYMLQALLTSDAQARLDALQPYLYDEWYVDDDGNYVYDPDDKTGLTHVDYIELLIQEIEEKYAVDLGEGDERDLSKILAMLGISLDGESGETGSKDMFDMIDAKRFNAAIDKDADDVKLRITDRMLAAALSDQLNVILAKDGSDFNGLAVGIDALTFVRNADHPERTYAMLAAEIGVSGLLDSLGEANVLSKLAANVLPEKLLLSITVDVTLSLPAGEQYHAASFMFNDYENTDRVVATLGKLIPSLDLSAMTGDIEKLLRDMLLQLDQTLGIDLVPADISAVPVKQGELVMTDIFEVITKTVLVDEAGEPIELQTDLKTVLKALNDNGSDVEVVPAKDNYSEFLSQVADMYYLDMQVTQETTIDDLTEFLKDGEQGFDAGKFRVKAKDGAPPQRGVKYLIYDGRSADELKPCMEAAELGYLISSKMTGGVQSYELIGVKTSHDKLIIELSVAISDVMPDKVHNLIAADNITVTATVLLDTVENGAYAVDMQINRMDEATYSDLTAIIRLFGVDLDIDSQVAELGKIMYEQMQSIGDGLGGEERMTFTDRGIEFDSFYGFLASKMDLLDASPETVKRALQGMYEISEIEEYVNREYNYDTSDFIVNRGSDKAMSQAEFAVKAANGMTDAEFNGYFQGLISAMADNSVDVVQTTVIKSGMNDGMIKAVRDRLNSKLDGSPVSLTDDYLAVTFKMIMNEFMSSDKSSSAGFLPDHVYATAVIKYDAATNAFVDIGIVFNDMDCDVYDVLLQLMGLSADAEDDSKVNIKTVTAQAVDGLNALARHGKFEFGAVSGGEHGTVKYVAEV